MTDNDWTDPSEAGEVELRFCDTCGQERLCLWSDDPYTREVDPDDDEAWWCRPCYETRAGDV